MKPLTFRNIAIVTALGALLAIPALAQPGGMGGGMGQGPRMQSAAQSGPQGGRGPGARGMRFNQTNTPGWSLMTTEERSAHQAKMRAVKTYDECKAVQAEQRSLMEARAKERGVTLPTPRQNGCDNMKARGFIQ